MTDINTSAIAARENAREASGQFGAQEHSAPELALIDPKRKAVDDILAQRYGFIGTADFAAGDGPGIDEIRDLMLEAIEKHRTDNPSVVVIDGEGKANDSAGVEIIDLDYLGEHYDDGSDSDFHVERATEDLDRLRAAGLTDISAVYSLRQYIGEELDLEWYDDTEHVLGGRYGDYVVDEGYPRATNVKVRSVETGEVISTHATFTEAKAAAEAL